MVILDTSVWIGAFRNRRKWLPGMVRNLMQRGRAAICEQVRYEFLRGFRDKALGEKFEKLLDGLPCYPTDRTVYNRAMDYSRRFPTLGAGDALIAVTAALHNCILLTFDGDFDAVAKTGEIELFRLVDDSDRGWELTSSVMF